MHHASSLIHYDKIYGRQTPQEWTSLWISACGTPQHFSQLTLKVEIGKRILMSGDMTCSTQCKYLSGPTVTGYTINHLVLLFGLIFWWQLCTDRSSWLIIATQCLSEWKMRLLVFPRIAEISSKIPCMKKAYRLWEVWIIFTALMIWKITRRRLFSVFYKR